MDIIDFHTHTFPDSVALKAVTKLGTTANIINYLDGTDRSLSFSTVDNNFLLSVVLPVATRAGQADAINAKSVKKNECTCDTRLLYFGAIHPEDSNIRLSLSNLKKAGFKGIKLHPAYQETPINDPAYLKILDMASGLDLITVIHAGYDFSCPDSNDCDVSLILDMLKQVSPKNVVLAHMGGLMQWERVLDELAGAEVYLDTSFCLTPIKERTASSVPKPSMLSPDLFVKLVKAHGSHKIIFGSDSPWASQAESVQAVIDSGLSECDIKKIFSDNAKRLLGI